MSVKIENVEVVGWSQTIRGMRNPKNSWHLSDSGRCDHYCECCDDQEKCGWYNPAVGTGKEFRDDNYVGPKDRKLMMSLAKGGPVHAKYRRYIVVYLDITAPLYWWKEFDTYRVGVAPNPTDIEFNSCSTMHKIHEKPFTLDDFSREHLFDTFSTEEVFASDDDRILTDRINQQFLANLESTIDCLNMARDLYLETKDKKYWWQMIQLLPSSYNQKRTVMLNYEVLANMWEFRKNHKQDEWANDMCGCIKTLPYSEIITGEEESNL